MDRIETALAALKSCVQVIDNPDVIPVLDAVISANLNPETESESCLDRLVATTYVNNVDKATLSVIVPILLRGLRVRGMVKRVTRIALAKLSLGGNFPGGFGLRYCHSDPPPPPGPVASSPPPPFDRDG